MVEPIPARMLWLVAGFVVWAVAFVVIYTIQAVGCAYDWSLPVHRGVLAIALALHLAAIGGMILKAPRGADRAFLERVTLYTLWAALIATLVTYGPALFVSVCI